MSENIPIRKSAKKRRQTRLYFVLTISVSIIAGVEDAVNVLTLKHLSA